MDRYHRQSLLPQIGIEGQARLARSRVAVLGCGALGTVAAELLVRAGVRFVQVIDRDLVELTNLQRQMLYAEADVGEPKAAAAAGRLRAINSAVRVEPSIADVHAGNVHAVLTQFCLPDLVIDGSDNAELRYLLNDWCVREGVPWVYGAAVGVTGRSMPVLPGRSACLRCVFPDPPAAGELPTCDTAGVLGAVTAMVGAVQVASGMEILVAGAAPGGDAPSGRGLTGTGFLTCVDGWPLRVRQIDLAEARRADCPACGARRFEFLDNPAAGPTTSLCGQKAVQVRPAAGKIDLVAIGQKLSAAGTVQTTPLLVRCDLAEPAGCRMTVFGDGRAIVQGTTDASVARAIYARFVGN